MQTLRPLLCASADPNAVHPDIHAAVAGLWLWKLFPDLRTCMPLPWLADFSGAHPPLFLPQT